MNDDHGSLTRRATTAAVVVSASLAFAKLGAWFATGSIAVLGSLVDSLLDLGASMVSFVGVRRARVPADDDHGFGHGKAEPLAALAQSAFLLGSAVFVAMEAVPRIFNPPAVTRPAFGIAVMLVGVAATIPLVLYQRSVARRTNSLAVAADAAHYASDIFGHLAVAVGLALASTPSLRIVDPLLGLLVALYVGYQAVSIGRKSVDMLMDRELPDAVREAVLEAALTHPEVCGVLHWRTRASGPQRFADMVVVVDGNVSLHHVHVVQAEVVGRIREVLPDGEITVRVEPAD